MSASIQIRRAVERLEARGRGVRYPVALRAKLVSDTRSRREAGKTLEAIGDQRGRPFVWIA